LDKREFLVSTSFSFFPTKKTEVDIMRRESENLPRKPKFPTKSRQAICNEIILRRIKEAIEGSIVERQARWLGNSIGFDQSFVLSSRKKVIANRLLDDLLAGPVKVYKLTQKQTDFEVICANLLYGQRQNRPISVSMDRNVWCLGGRWRTSPFIIEAIHMLAKSAFIHMKKGYQYGNQARQARMWATKRLTELFIPMEVEDVQFNPVDIIMLRDEKGKLVDYQDTQETHRVRDILQKVNTVNSQALVQLAMSGRDDKMHRLETNLHAVYNVDFQHGGRLYTSTTEGYQLLSKEERKDILIDHQPTIELDFSGMLPRILYAWEGIQFDGDPYSILPDDPEMRPIFKKVFLALLNAKNEITAVQAGNQFLRKNWEYCCLMRERELKVKDHLIPWFKEAHKQIAHLFCQGSGLEVMNLDAKITLDVIEHFTNREIPVLSIHDSFIVYRHLRDSFIVHRQCEDELKQVMQSAYRCKTGGFECPVERA